LKHKELLTAVKVLPCPKPSTVSKSFHDGKRQLWSKSQSSLVPLRPNQGHWTASDRLCVGHQDRAGTQHVIMPAFVMPVNGWHIPSKEYYRCRKIIQLCTNGARF